MNSAMLKETKYGFCPDCGTVDAIFIFRQRKKKFPLNFPFTDFKSAFVIVWGKDR